MLFAGVIHRLQIFLLVYRDTSRGLESLGQGTVDRIGKVGRCAGADYPVARAGGSGLVRGGFLQLSTHRRIGLIWQ